ncbi:glycosyltransferase [Arthrobacter koreensis]|uniref:glycosyltransferase n=1 Tax=Arthrobacter koreensis TaxID=199136 RepID=UPI00362E44A7
MIGHTRASAEWLKSAVDRQKGKEARSLRRLLEASKAKTGAEATLSRYRNGVARFPRDADLWYAYGRTLLETKRSEAALEAFAQALHHNPAHLMALEYFVSLSTIAQFGKRKGDIGPAIDSLAVAIDRRDADTFGALDFLIPHGRTEAIHRIAGQRADKLGTAAAKIAVALEKGVEEFDVPQGRDTVRHQTAYASVLLARGRYTSAVLLLQSMSDTSVPVHAVRRAVRRALAGKRPESAVPLLHILKRVKPQDSWVSKQLSEFDETKRVSNYMLTRAGFPLPPRSPKPRYRSHPKKVLYTLHNALPYHSAGYATRTHGLLSGLNRSGFDVEGVTRLGYPFDMPGKADLGPIESSHLVDGVTYSHLSTQPGLEMKKPLFDYVQRYAAALEAFASQRKPAILHAASNHWNGLATVTAANRLGIPSVYEVRGLWEVTRGSRNPEWVDSGMYRMISRMEADAAKGATSVLTITRALKDELVRRGVDESKITVVPNGVDTNRFRPLNRDNALAEQLGVQNKTVIGYVGSILDYEGLELLLEAAQAMKSTRKDFHVLIVGDGAELDSFKHFAAKMELGNVVTFTGRVPHADVERYYSIIDIAPFPRLPLAVCEMVSPLKPFEAMAMGKAVVASDVAALAEIVIDEATGLLHKKGDAGDLQRALEKLLDDSMLRKSLGERALDWVRVERDWNTLSSRVTKVYEALADKSGDDRPV